MIINRKYLKNKKLYKDNCGESGFSGQLYTLEASDGVKYIVKTHLVDVLNEYVAHNVAKIIDVPTSDAVLIVNNKNDVNVGIVYEPDFNSINANVFLGTEDSLLLADFMSYMALRNMLLIDDNIQVAIVRNRLISFDYAEAFCFSELFLKLFITFGSRPWPISVDLIEAFTRNLSIDLPNGYHNLLRIIKRADAKPLREAYYAPMMKFQEANFQSIIEELSSLFIPPIVEFYGECLRIIKEQTAKLLTN